MKYQAVSPERLPNFPLPDEIPEIPLSDQHSWVGEELQPDAQDPLLGQTLQGTYLVVRVLGAGGMGRVYEARHTRITSKRYAIKVLHAEFARNPELRERFHREAEAAASIEHSGVVGTYDVGETPEGWPYMVCELLVGVDLNAYLKTHGALAAEVVAHIGKQLASALDAAHAEGVIHRDLKPHNIFVLGPSAERSAHELPTVKVLDFGLSRFMERDTELTKTGIIIGTPGYMAPEQAMGRETDIRTDVYGIGALLYAMATGQAPFVEETPQLTVLAVMNREPLRPGELNPQLPVELEIVIQKAMAREASDRYQTALDIGEALTRLYAPLGPLNRRGEQKNSRLLSNPRLRLGVTLGVFSVFLGSAAFGAALGAVELLGNTLQQFRPSLLEWLLLALLGVVSVGASGTALYLFERRVWNNSARVAELVPKTRGALAALLSAYGVGALFLLTVGAGRAAIDSKPIASSLSSQPTLLLVLFAIASLSAAIALLKSLFARTQRRALRAITQTIVPALGVLLGLWLLTLPLGRTEGSEPSLSVTSGTSGASEDSTTSPEAPTGASPSAADTSSDSRASKPGPAARELAPKEDLDIAIHDGPEALLALQEKYPKDAKVRKALVLAYASRAETLDRSLGSISELLEIDPAANKDSDVVFILKKALLLKGRPYTAAASAVRNHMGPEGAELLYQLMSERPEHRARLKELFQELRKTKRAAPNVLIAYDLRYASSCQARVPLLERAEQYGDLRSLHQLQALSTAPKRCGWGRTCYPPCKAEAEKFRKSAKVIARRLESSP